MAHHMILTYRDKWPTNNFQFRVPYNQSVPKNIEHDFKDCVEFIHTDVPFKKTVSGLLQDLDDMEWVYWCIDDKYLISIDEVKANMVREFVEQTQDPGITGVSFQFVRWIEKTAQPASAVNYKGLTFLQHTSKHNNWLHQFYRVGTLRKLVDHVPDPVLYKMNILDRAKHRLTLPGKLLTLNHNIAIHGESTTCSKITLNCVESFNKYNLPFPGNFEISNKQEFVE
jgi:hypothetical protein